MFKQLKNKRGQAFLEYALIAAAVIALVVLLITKVKSPAQARVNDIATGMATPAN